MAFLEGFGNVMMWFTIIIFVIQIFSLLNNISRYFSAKSQRELQEAIRIKNENETTNSNVMDQFTFSISIMDLIDRLIGIEVEKLITGFILIDKKYEMTNFDTDIKTITDTVYKAIRPEVYVSHDMLLDQEYLIKTIQERTTHVLIDACKTYNANYIPSTPQE